MFSSRETEHTMRRVCHYNFRSKIITSMAQVDVHTPHAQVQRQTIETDEPALDTLSALPVYTKRSRIPGVRGDGAFAARDLLEGEVIGEYAGEIVRDAELAGARGSSRYV